ncbi:MAG: molybdopterin-binding protein [Flammeovirgaceae bacterium]|nr:MAG: molybdopterin-binding protein [Flammeovirgaceae bacterium]
MNRLVTVLILLTLFGTALAQQSLKPTTEFVVTGRMKNPELVIKNQQLAPYTSYEITNLTITNHLGEKRSTIKTARGVRIKDVLEKVQPDAGNPKEYSEYYFVFTANDNYKVVFSWNELFNSPLGDQAYFIVEKDGKPVTQLDEGISILVPADVRTGRRYLKNLARVYVGRAE